VGNPWDLSFSEAVETPIILYDDGISKDQVDVGMSSEEISHPLKSAWQVLLVAIDIGQKIALRLVESAIDRVVHATIFFDIGAYARVFRKPFKRTVIRDGILNDMLMLHLLVRD